MQLSVPVKREQLSALPLLADNVPGMLRCVSGKGELKLQMLTLLLLNHPEWGSGQDKRKH